ncbi:MAG: B12-binding domain-containing radical SAM protein [Nitrospirota bacterium]
MKVLLVSVNRETEPFTAAPLGLALVASALRRAGHDVHALDLLFADDPEVILKQTIHSVSPELVAVSIRNLESSSRFLLPDYRDIIGLIKRETKAPVVLGGPGYSIMPKAALEYLGADFGIAGEGELAVPMLADAFQGKIHLSSVPGLCRFEGGSYIQNPPSPLTLQSLDIPAWDLFPTEKYDLLGIQSKRGCSFSCTYCTYPGLEGMAMRLRPPAEVAREMTGAIDSGLSAPFYFVDNIFNNPPGHASAICDEIISRGIKSSFGCLASPVGLDGRLLDKMKRAGCESVEIGADSLSDGVLLKLGKRFTKKDALNSILAAKETGLMSLVFLILGGPGEDADTLQETFSVLDKIQPDKVFAVAGVRIYPGTPLARLAVKERLIQPDDPLMMPEFYVSDKLGDGLYSMAEDYFKAHPDWVCYPAKGILQGVHPDLKAGDATLVPAVCAKGISSGNRLDKNTRSAVSVRGISSKKHSELNPGETPWDDFAMEVFEKVLSEVPALFRPIARKAVRKKALSAAMQGSGKVRAQDIKDAFLSETPRPFQGPMREALGRLGLLDG